MKSVFAGVSAVALAVAGAAGIASALGNEQTNNAPTAANQAQQPVYRCESLGIDHIARDSYKFSVKYAAYNGATYKGTVYRVYDANGKEVYNTASAKFNGFEPGNYTAKAFVTVSVNGKDETVTSDSCTKTFTIKAAQNDQNNKPDKPSEPAPKPQEPPKPTDPNQNKPDDQKPTPQQPSKPDNQNKPNNPTPQQPSTPAKPTEPSKPTTPTKPSQPDTKPTTPNTPNTPSKPAAPANPAPTNQQSSPTAAANSNATPAAKTTETNTANSPSNNASTPNQLPKTGISELAGLAGTGSLGYALYAYIVSRKNR